MALHGIGIRRSTREANLTSITKTLAGEMVASRYRIDLQIRAAISNALVTQTFAITILLYMHLRDACNVETTLRYRIFS